jgi:5-methylcytosine-specific restriction protein B
LGDGEWFGHLVEAIRQGLPKEAGSGIRKIVAAMLEEHFPKRLSQQVQIRDAYALGQGEEKDGVPYAGLIHPDNPESGPYGGTSLVWFPTGDHGSLMSFVVGTRGLSPDEGILTKPGHRRRLAALRRYLSELKVPVWTKTDPSALDQTVPKVAQELFPGFESVFKRYGEVLYCLAKVPEDAEAARTVVSAFLALYAHERNWQPLAAYRAESEEILGAMWGRMFDRVDATRVHDLLRERRFVIIQGPPGTGKTRLAEQVLREQFAGRGMTVQFHPAVTYEDFLVGLSPDAESGELRFDVRPGWLVRASRLAEQGPALLVIDEINRADLAKVLGEAVFLFEPSEVGGPRARCVRLAHPVNGSAEFRMPENLYVLATMNTADRSIAPIDIAIRRRFAFVTLRPQRNVVVGTGLALALKVFDDLAGVFVEHVPEDGLDLLPGHAYFLAGDEAELRRRFRYELVPLLDEYLRQGLVGPAASELQAVRDSIADLASA